MRGWRPPGHGDLRHATRPQPKPSSPNGVAVLARLTRKNLSCWHRILSASKLPASNPRKSCHQDQPCTDHGTTRPMSPPNGFYSARAARLGRVAPAGCGSTAHCRPSLAPWGGQAGRPAPVGARPAGRARVWPLRQVSKHRSCVELMMSEARGTCCPLSAAKTHGMFIPGLPQCLPI